MITFAFVLSFCLFEKPLNQPVTLAPHGTSQPIY